MSDNDNYTDQSNYGYTPSLGWSVAFIVLFGLSALVHSYQAFRSRKWIVYPTLVLGALIEVLGWSGRLWSHLNVLYLPPFLMQITTLIMAPVFFSAYNYILLGQAITHLGPVYSMLRPKWYFAVFLVADVISLILQAVGGGQAASSAAEAVPTDSATNIMVAGIIFQLISMAVFVVLGVDFVVRKVKDMPYGFRKRQMASDEVKAEAKRQKKLGEGNGEKRLKQMDSDTTIAPTTATSATDNNIKADVEYQAQPPFNVNPDRWFILLAASLFSSIAIVTRGIFRSIELSAGWESDLAQTEILQAVLDGLMMVLAVGVFNFINPLYLLPRKTSWRGE